MVAVIELKGEERREGYITLCLCGGGLFQRPNNQQKAQYCLCLCCGAHMIVSYSESVDGVGHLQCSLNSVVLCKHREG